MMTLVWLFVKANWKSIALVVGLLALFAWHKMQVNQAWTEGREALRVEQRAEAQRRDADANAADAAARKCGDDPACLLRNDGHRRD